jgi:hypothetical protein
MAWSKRAQSELIREERSRTVRENGVRKNDEDSHWTPTIPIFGQLGNLRERREKRRSGKHSRLCGEIVLAHVFDDGARGPVAPRKRKPIRGETHDAARRRTHHDNMVKADWVKYPMDRSRQREASATFSSKGLTCEDVHVCSTHGATSPRRRHDRNSEPFHLGERSGVAGVEATPSTKAELDQRGTKVRRADGSFLGGLTLPLRLRRLGRRSGASETKR